MKKPTIALVMCVKNEEKGLAKAVESCRDFVDEIHISVDRKSTDRTLEIAKSLTNHIKIFDFADDFSKMRNDAQIGIKTDWLFFLDGHEYVARADRLTEALRASCDGLNCKIRMENGFEFRNPRIYKNGVWFVGKVHEQQQCKKILNFDTFIVQHNRIDGQDKKSSAERDIQRDYHMINIVGKESKDFPDDTRASFQLAIFYESRADYKKAIYYQNLYLRYSKNEQERWFMLFSRSLCHLALGNHFRAFWSASMAEFELPSRWENEKLKGLVYFSAGKYEKALEKLVNSFNTNKKDHMFKPWPREDSGTWNLIGECFYRRGVYDKASIAFNLASESCTEEKQKKFFTERAELMKKMLGS